MSEEILEAIVEANVDFATAIEAAAVDYKQRISQIYGVGKLKEDPFLSLKGWTKTQGDKLGDFEFTTKEANNNSDAFNRCFNILKANDATIKQHFGERAWQYFYWLWPERDDTIYRKSRKVLEPKPEVDIVESIKAKFSENLSQMLMFEQEGEYVTIKPRQYLRSENFAKIASIVRGEGGEYVSAGKGSYFRIPRK